MRVFFFLLFMKTVCAYCQCDGIDRSFGNNGFVTTAADSADLFNVGKAALQSDGKIIVSGIFSKGKMPQLIRYMPNGIVDYSFGDSGIASIDTFRAVIAKEYTMAVKPINAVISAIAIQQDGKIVVAGNITSLTELFAARFMADGKPDTSFANRGIFADFEFSSFDEVNAIALQSDGKLLITGGKVGSSILFEAGVLMRLNTNGSIDKSFAKDGRFQNKIDYVSENEAAACNKAIAIQQDGKIVTTGYQDAGEITTHNYVVSRYNTDGMPDQTFGNMGNAITKMNDINDNPQSIGIQSDGKIVISGVSAVDRITRKMIVLRYTANGTLDNTFGTNGKVTISFSGDVESCTALLQPNGKIILAGSIYIKNSNDEEDFCLSRINENGTIDSTFGVDGKKIIVSEQSNDSFQSALLKSNDKIVLVGYSWYNEHLTAVLAQYCAK